MMPKKAAPIPLLTLVLLATFAAFGAMLPTAALPTIATYFHISTGASENVMAWYLAGYALAQLIYGPLANALGRKKTILIGAYLALGSSVLGAVSAYLKLFDLYLITRLLSGLGAGAGLIVGMILIKDLYEKTEARQIFSKVILIFSFVPFIAISLGGVLIHYGNWQSLNGILIAYSLLFLGLAVHIPETFTLAQRMPISIRSLTSAYCHLFKSKSYLKLGFIFALASAINYTFNGLAPLFVIHILHVSAAKYGYLSVMPALGLFIGGYVSQHFAHHLSALKMIGMAQVLMLIAVVGLSISFAAGQINLPVFYGMAILLFCGQAMVVANAGMEALTHVKDHANGSSFMNAFALMLGSMSVAVTGHLFSLNVLVLPLVLLLMVLLGGMLMIFGLRSNKIHACLD